MYMSKRVRLRRVDPVNDVDDRYRWMNDPHVVKFLGMRPARLSREQVKKYLEQCAAEASEIVEFAIETHDGRHIGGCTLRGFNRVSHAAEFGIAIGEADYRGKGFGTEVTRLVLKIAFEEFNLNRVWLHVNEDNPGAWKAYEKAGFVKEGLLRQDTYVGGRYYNSYIMAALRSEYENPKGSA